MGGICADPADGVGRERTWWELGDPLRTLPPSAATAEDAGGQGGEPHTPASPPCHRLPRFLCLAVGRPHPSASPGSPAGAAAWPPGGPAVSRPGS